MGGLEELAVPWSRGFGFHPAEAAYLVIMITKAQLVLFSSLLAASVLMLYPHMDCCPHAVQFGDSSTSDCLVSEWSDWSSCSSTTLPGTLDTVWVKTRTRSVISGSIECPSLQEISECGKPPTGGVGDPRGLQRDTPAHCLPSSFSFCVLSLSPPPFA